MKHLFNSRNKYNIDMKPEPSTSVIKKEIRYRQKFQQQRQKMKKTSHLIFGFY